MHTIDTNFQTPPAVAKYMVGLLPPDAQSFLEPTPGVGNLVDALIKDKEGKLVAIHTPENFFKHNLLRYDAVLMNPPFSAKYAFGVPEGIEKHGMRLGYHILKECMGVSDNIVALMPWFTISDSDVRLRFLKSYGLISLTALPRKTFQYARIQTVVIQLQKGYGGDTLFKTFDF